MIISCDCESRPSPTRLIDGHCHQLYGTSVYYYICQDPWFITDAVRIGRIIRTLYSCIRIGYTFCIISLSQNLYFFISNLQLQETNIPPKCLFAIYYTNYCVFGSMTHSHPAWNYLCFSIKIHKSDLKCLPIWIPEVNINIYLNSRNRMMTFLPTASGFPQWVGLLERYKKCESLYYRCSAFLSYTEFHAICIYEMEADGI